MNIQDFDNVEIVKLLLHKRGMTQKALSEGLGTHPVNFSQKLNKNNLKIRDLQKICSILGYELVLKEKKE